MCRKQSTTVTQQNDHCSCKSDKNIYSDLDTNLDTYAESFDKVLSNIGSITNSIFDISMETGKEINDKARSLFNKDSDSFNDYPPFFQHGRCPQSNQFPVLTDFQNISRDGFNLLDHYNYKSPTIRQYHKCLDKNGISIWDEYGFWRCLFPQSELNNKTIQFKQQFFKDKILTKEDFLQKVKDLSIKDFKNADVIDLKSNGKWFNKFDDFLNYKHNKFSTELKEKEQSRHQVTQEFSIVSTSISSNMYTDLDKNEIKFIENKKECFENGECNLTKIIKSRPIGTSDWVNVEEYKETTTSSSSVPLLNDNSSANEEKQGWFWNKK